ncbi:MAG: hypothetical protein ACTHLB_14545 [Parafilimonas sp.]
MIPQTLQQFKQQSESDKAVIKCKLLHAVETNEKYYRYLVNILENAELEGVYNNVKFGSEAYQEPIY